MTVADDKDMFRKEALEQLSSPEQLERLLEVTTRKAWIGLYTIAATLFCIVLWGVFGQIPITVDGSGIFVYPRRVVSFQAPAPGQVVTMTVGVGDFVKKGDLIGTINQPDLMQELEQERVRLVEARTQTSQKDDVLDKRMDLEREAIARKRELLNARIESLSRISTAQKTRNESFLAQQRENLAEARSTQQKLGEALEERFESYERLRSEGLSSDDSVLAARQRYMDNQVQRSDLDLKTQELELRRLENEQAYQQSIDRIEEFRNQLQELEIRERDLQQQELETATTSAQRIQEIERNIARLEAQLTTRGQIVSEHSGRILEITAGPGQIVNGGQRIGSIETEDEEGELMGVAFFAVGDGKKLAENGLLRLTPTTVERERFGSIIAEIVNVSAFPVTTDAISSLVGNAEVAQDITQGRSVIQVVASLQEDADAYTGFKWTSGKGPPGPLTAGTTAGARATVEYRRPITFVIPILRRWTGIG